MAVLPDIRQISIPQHRHDFFEIVTVLSGTATHVTDGFHHRVTAGEVMIIGGGRRHGYEESEALCITNILVDFEIMERLLRRLEGMAGFHHLFAVECARHCPPAYPSHVRLQEADLAQLKTLLESFDRETQRSEGGASALAEAYLTLIVGLLARCYEKGNATELPEPSGRLRPLLDWIEKELQHPLGIDDLARKAGMSRRVLERRFRGEFGITPTEYLLNARIRKASQILRDPAGEARITEIAGTCGFDDGNYFSRCFRKVTGRTPREYRACASGGEAADATPPLAEGPPRRFPALFL